MPKVVVSLTDTQIRSALTSHKKQAVKAQTKLADGKGLFFIIEKNGKAYWRWDYINFTFWQLFSGSPPASFEIRTG